MKFRSLISVSLFILLLCNSNCFSQEEEEKRPKKPKSAKGFHVGLFVGYYYANKYTSNLYDGWGYDENGKRNDFTNSFMYRRIVNDYGGGNSGTTDQIAVALGVDPTANPKQWSFDETDMPVKMKYSPALLFGLQMNYGITKKDALVFNLSAVKINLIGSFAMVITNPIIGPQPPGYQNLKYFSITGGEQRLMLQMGYRRILGENDFVNFFIEAGPALNYTKFIKNQITINNLPIDLSFYYTQPYYPTYRASYLRGTGFGAFAGFGINITASPKWTLQFLYNPSYEKINIGQEPKPALQNSFGLRAFYNL